MVAARSAPAAYAALRVRCPAADGFRALVVFRVGVPMVTPTHASTPARMLLVAAAIAITIAIGSCAASKKDVAHARGSVYDADFALVYSAALAAVRAKYPTSDEDAVAGRIRTAWHQVQASRPGEDPNQVVARDPSALSGNSGGFVGATGA